MTDIRVGDLMTQDPICVSPDKKILDCAKLMVQKKVGGVLVTRGKEICGIVTHNDLLWAMLKKSKEELAHITVDAIAKKKVHTLHPEDFIDEALQKMYRLRLRRLPVVNSNGELVGLLTAKDVLLLHSHLYDELNELVDIRETTKKLQTLQSKQRKHVQEGICDECGRLDVLLHIDGRMICPLCREEM